MAAREDGLNLTEPASSGSDGKTKDKPPTLSFYELEHFVSHRMEAGSKNLYGEVIARIERHLISQVLRRTGGNQLRAAAILGITRTSLRHKMRSLGLVIERSVTIGEKSHRLREAGVSEIPVSK